MPKKDYIIEKTKESIIINGITINKITNDYSEYYIIIGSNGKKIEKISKYERMDSLYELLKEMIKND